MYISELKHKAKLSLKGRKLKAAGASLIFILLASFVPLLIQSVFQTYFGYTVSHFICIIISLLIYAALSVGIIKYFMSFADRRKNTELSLLFSGFSSFYKVLAFEILVFIVVYAVRFLILYLGNIIAAVSDPNPFLITFLILIYIVLYILIIYFILRLSFVIFIFAESNEITLNAAIKRSLFLTKGYAGKLFLTGLSFILWVILCILIIPVLYVFPYMQLTFINFYQKLKMIKDMP